MFTVPIAVRTFSHYRGHSGRSSQRFRGFRVLLFEGQDSVVEFDCGG